ncbi:MAG TPA: APC family permease [Candidatus Krumholzibacteria bacterium]|nr:APC family permease [Candidatus Krumholzibacteria bacterium]
MVLKRVLGAGDAGWLVAGNMIGAGIFITPGLVAGALPGAVWPLVAWTLGGVVSLAGAAVYGELGARLPRAGGDYQYLHVAFGPLWGFLTGWAALIVTFSGAAAVMAIVTMDNVTTAWPALAELPGLLRAVLPALLVVALSAGNVAGARVAGQTTIWLTALPVAGLVVLFGAGLLLGGDVAGGITGAPGAGPTILPGGAAATPAVLSLVALGGAMMPVFFTYSGWNVAAYVAGEIRQPQRELPKGLVLGTLGVTLFYVAFNLLLLVVLPHQVMAGSTTAAALAAQQLLGKGAERVLAVLVAMAVLGTANVTLMAGARIYYAMALDDLAPRALATTNAAGVPSMALWAGGIWTALFSLTGRIEVLVNWSTLAILLLSSLAVAALFVFRHTGTEEGGGEQAAGEESSTGVDAASSRAGDKRAGSRTDSVPYRCPGYPVTPALYLLVSLGVAVASAVQDWKQALYGVLIVLAGVPVYAWWQRGRRRRSPMA